jgi:hypothetical protein
MKIQYASDNWRYLKEHPLIVAGDILVLSGGIAYLDDKKFITVQ